MGLFGLFSGKGHSRICLHLAGLEDIHRRVLHAGRSIISASLACLADNCGDLLGLLPGDVLCVAIVLAHGLIGGVILDPVGTVEDNVVDLDIEGLLLEGV